MITITFDDLVKNLPSLFSSFRRKPEPSYFKTFWTPAFAGVTFQLNLSETYMFE